MQATPSGSLKNIWFYPPDENGSSTLTLKFKSKVPINFSGYIPENLRAKIAISQPQPEPYANQKVKALSERMVSIKIQESPHSMLQALEILGCIKHMYPKVDVFPIEIFSYNPLFNSVYLTPPNERGQAKLTFEFKKIAPTNPRIYIPEHLQPNAFLRQPKDSPYYSAKVKTHIRRVVAVEIQESDYKSMATTLEILAHTFSTFENKKLINFKVVKLSLD
ncbi:MAG: hypothetical protein CK425_01955 [Parachlamydia sp.]|nr:MAG: hypothetical protein CK425_01955 [Parachlamydia sp.]